MHISGVMHTLMKLNHIYLQQLFYDLKLEIPRELKFPDQVNYVIVFEIIQVFIYRSHLLI